MMLFVSENIQGDPRRHNRIGGRAHVPTLGFGTIDTEGMICTCQGYSCSCVGVKEAHCVLEDYNQCLDGETSFDNSTDNSFISVVPIF